MFVCPLCGSFFFRVTQTNSLVLGTISFHSNPNLTYGTASERDAPENIRERWGFSTLAGGVAFTSFQEARHGVIVPSLALDIPIFMTSSFHPGLAVFFSAQSQTWQGRTQHYLNLPKKLDVSLVFLGVLIWPMAHGTHGHMKKLLQWIPCRWTSTCHQRMSKNHGET